MSQPKIFVADRISRMEESATLKMAQKARDLKAQGVNVISLSLGEPDFDTPQHIKDAAIKALNDGYTKYTPVAGLPKLKVAIQEKFKRDNNLDYALDEIVVSNGAKQSFANVSLSLLNDGDEVLLFAPYWVSYYEIIKLAGGVPVVVSANIDNDYKVTAAQVEAAITGKTKFILFSSPCNPTGMVYSYDELKEIAAVVSKFDGVYIVSDEIYELINFTENHVSIGSFPSVKDRTITINGFSKGFAMTGWRLGYMGAPKHIAAACTKMQGQFTSGATAFGQRAAAYALGADMTATDKMVEVFRQRRGLVTAGLKKIPGMKVNHPEGAFYVFPDISAFFGKSYGKYTINNSDDFCEFLLEEGHVATVAGSAFGANDCFRISYAASEDELREAINRIGDAVAKLQ